MKRFSIVVLLGLIAAISLSAAQKSKPEKSKRRINEIDLEGRQGTRGNELFGPGFKITLRRDGTALFMGKAKVKLIGDFQGTITGAEFEHLVSSWWCEIMTEFLKTQLTTQKLLHPPALLDSPFTAMNLI